ncbi:MAG: lipolytic protein family [Planctomycetaceae bacterium]|nr:lipolytic protein family [Planctomycetaceae bacterium]
MNSRDSQSRRRRLIHHNLLGKEASRAERVEQHSPAAISDEDAVEQATQAVLATVSTRVEKVKPLTGASSTISTAEESHRLAGLGAILALLRRKSSVTWLFTGDNIVQGAGCTDGRRSCVELFAERIRGELRRAGDVVINTGVSGDSAPQLLATLKRRALRYRPDVVVISLGINDCKAGTDGREPFRLIMRDILDRVRTAGAIPLVILPHPVYVPATRNRSDLRQYVEILRQEIVRDEVPCVDQWTDWLQHWPDPTATRGRLADGRIQLNAAAHQHLAGLIFQTLQIFDSQSAACFGSIAK